MNNIVLKPQANIFSDRNNLLNSKLNKRFDNSTYQRKRQHKIFDNLSEFEQKQLLKEFKLEYSLILFDYFSNKTIINQKIEVFTKKAFDVSLPIGKIVEIHLHLIDNLEHQLKLEGLQVEYLSDFRLTLIDVIAHLGELYRNALNVKCKNLSKNVSCW